MLTGLTGECCRSLGPRAIIYRHKMMTMRMDVLYFENNIEFSFIIIVEGLSNVLSLIIQGKPRMMLRKDEIETQNVIHLRACTTYTKARVLHVFIVFTCVYTILYYHLP